MADETTPSPIPDVPEDLGTLNDDELRGIHAELQGLYEVDRAGILSPAMRERLTDIRARQARIASELTERIAVANDLDTTPDLPEVPEPAEESAPETPEPAPEEVPADLAPATASVEDIDIAAAVIGGRDTVSGPSPEGSPARPTERLVATAGLGGDTLSGDDGTIDYTAMTSVLDRGMEKIKDQSEARLTVARLAGFDPTTEGPFLGDSAQENTRLWRESAEQWRERFDANFVPGGDGAGSMARVAAICDPLDIIREIPMDVDASEPFSDSLPSRAAGRLGFQFIPPLALSSVSSGVDIFDETDQAAVDPTNSATWKPCVAITCGTATTVRAEAVTACMSFPLTLDMSSPERVRDAMAKIRGFKARAKTARLLTIADTLSHHFEATAPYGALDGLIHIILTTLEQGEYPNRLGDGTPYIFYAPPGLLSSLVIDLEHETALDNARRQRAAAYIETSCANAGKNVMVVDLDDVATADAAPFATLPAVGAAGKAALPNMGGTTRPFKARLIAPEGALYFSTGELEAGVETSPDLHRQNRRQWFMEEFVGLAKPGSHPWYTLHLIICPNGTRAALTTAYACPTTAS